jgi:hypothetical protein
MVRALLRFGPEGSDAPCNDSDGDRGADVDDRARALGGERRRHGIRQTGQRDSEEHIFPNAIGGRRVVLGFLCVRCNNSTGHRWDAELARQLSQWTIFFDVTGRRNGLPPALRIETSSGEKLLLRGDGSLSLRHPSITETKTDTGSRFQLSVRGDYYDDDLVQNRPPGLPLHCVGIAGDPSTGLVLAYIEYCGIHRIVACLSET